MVKVSIQPLTRGQIEEAKALDALLLTPAQIAAKLGVSEEQITGLLRRRMISKIMNQDCVGGTTIQAHIQRTDGSQEMVKYDYLDLCHFLYLLNVPHGTDEAGMQRFLKNTFAGTAAKVYLNWKAEGEPEATTQYWINESVRVLREQCSSIPNSLPPGMTEDDANWQLYQQWQRQNLEPIMEG